MLITRHGSTLREAPPDCKVAFVIDGGIESPLLIGE